jgi:uncharacterized protein YbjT (DUF2867 family)
VHEPIAIVGGNGRQGSATARTLLERGEPVRAIVRDPAKAADLAAAGAEVAVADVSDEGATAAALTGCRAMFLALPLLFDLEQEVALGRSAIAAAQVAGVPYLVYTAGLDAGERDIGAPFVDAKRRIIAAARGSGVPTLVLRPTMFMENLLLDREAIAAGTLPAPVPAELRMNYVAVLDVGRACAAALLRPDLAGEEFGVQGPEALDGDERAQALSRALGHEVRYRQIALAEVEAVSPPFAAMWAEIAEQGGMGGSDASQMALQPGERHTLEAWARDAFAGA